jgi:hypothetical protein
MRGTYSVGSNQKRKYQSLDTSDILAFSTETDFLTQTQGQIQLLKHCVSIFFFRILDSGQSPNKKFWEELITYFSYTIYSISDMTQTA